MNPRIPFIALALTASFALAAPALAAPPPAPAAESGVIRVASAYSVDETVTRLKADIAAKGIKFFSEIDQAALGAEAKIPLRRSTLIQFGNPPLGIQFLTASPYAGLDWPVRMLVFEDADGKVWIAYTDFAYIGRRHQLKDRDAQLKMASEVAASIASAAQAH